MRVVDCCSFIVCLFSMMIPFRLWTQKIDQKMGWENYELKFVVVLAIQNLGRNADGRCNVRMRLKCQNHEIELICIWRFVKHVQRPHYTKFYKLNFQKIIKIEFILHFGMSFHLNLTNCTLGKKKSKGLVLCGLKRIW